MTGAAAVEIIPVDARDPVARACLDHYFDELAARFPEGFDRETDSATALDDYRPPDGTFLVAQISGEVVGCGAWRLFSPGVAEIKRMWVAPQARGRGVARKLLGALERAAAERHLHTVRLDTHASLAEAQQLYRTSGYRAIPRFNDNPYAHHWFEKTLD